MRAAVVQRTEQRRSGPHDLSDDNRDTHLQLKSQMVLSSSTSVLPIDDPYKIDDDDLLFRHLIAKKWDTKEAATSVVEYVEWRKALNVNSIFDTDVSMPIRRQMSGFYGRDREGHPVYYDCPDPKEINALIASEPRDTLIRWHVMIAERGRALAKHYAVDRMTCVLDLKHIGLGIISSPSVMKLLKEFSSIDQHKYPENMRVLCIINPPGSFKWIWKAVKPFLEERVQKKMRVCDKLNVLFEIVSPENVPSDFGGSGPPFRRFGEELDEVREALRAPPTPAPAAKVFERRLSVRDAAQEPSEERTLSAPKSAPVEVIPAPLDAAPVQADEEDEIGEVADVHDAQQEAVAVFNPLEVGASPPSVSCSASPIAFDTSVNNRSKRHSASPPPLLEESYPASPHNGHPDSPPTKAMQASVALNNSLSAPPTSPPTTSSAQSPSIQDTQQNGSNSNMVRVPTLRIDTTTENEGRVLPRAMTTRYPGDAPLTFQNSGSSPSSIAPHPMAYLSAGSLNASRRTSHSSGATMWTLEDERPALTTPLRRASNASRPSTSSDVKVPAAYGRILSIGEFDASQDATYRLSPRPPSSTSPPRAPAVEGPFASSGRSVTLSWVDAVFLVDDTDRTLTVRSVPAYRHLAAVSLNAAVSIALITQLTAREKWGVHASSEALIAVELDPQVTQTMAPVNGAAPQADRNPALLLSMSDELAQQWLRRLSSALGSVVSMEASLELPVCNVVRLPALLLSDSDQPMVSSADAEGEGWW